MGMTLTQKILAAHAGLPEVKAGQLINARLDIVLGNDITTPVAINEFEKAGFEVTTVVEGLGSVQAIQDLFVAHAQAAIDSLK